MTMVKPSVRVNSSVSVGALLRQRVLSKIVPLLSVLVAVLSAGRGQAFHNGNPGTKVGTMVKGGIATTAAVSATTSKVIAGALTKIPQGNLAVSAVLSAGTLLFSADEVEAKEMSCASTNYPNTNCEDVTIQGCTQGQTNNNCCQPNNNNACSFSSGADFGCCSCTGTSACTSSPNSVFYDNTCNGEDACSNSKYIRVYSGSCNYYEACQWSAYLIVGSGSCNNSSSCAFCCGEGGSSTGLVCNSKSLSGIPMIPDNECNSPSVFTSGNAYPSCPWCPNCRLANYTSCYNSLLTGQATLSDAGISDRRILQKKMSKQKVKTSKKRPMSCGSAKDKIVSYFQAQGIPKLRSKYTSGKVAKGSKQDGQRKRSRDCNVEFSWLFEHLEGDEIVQACTELENQKPKLQAYLGKDWTIQNLKCTPEDKNKIH